MLASGLSIRIWHGKVSNCSGVLTRFHVGHTLIAYIWLHSVDHTLIAYIWLHSVGHTLIAYIWLHSVGHTLIAYIWLHSVGHTLIAYIWLHSVGHTLIAYIWLHSVGQQSECLHAVITGKIESRLVLRDKKNLSDGRNRSPPTLVSKWKCHLEMGVGGGMSTSRWNFYLA